MNESVNRYSQRIGKGSPPPWLYDQINEVEARYLPQATKIKNSTTYRYCFRYYLEEIFNLFDFEGMPDEWDENYFKAVLYCTGKIAIINAAPYGWIPQDCHFGAGRNVYHFPTSVLICNPYFQPATPMPPDGYDISEENALIRLNALCLGIADIAAFYAYQKSCLIPLVSNSALISRNGWILGTNGKADAATLKAAVQDILNGEILAVVKEKEFAANRELTFTPFESDVRKHYIVSDAINDIMSIDDLFHAALGIGTGNRAKKERLIQSEESSINGSCRGNVEQWKDCLQAGFDNLKKISGGAVDIRVKENYEMSQEGGEDEGGDSVLQLDTVRSAGRGRAVLPS